MKRPALTALTSLLAVLVFLLAAPLAAQDSQKPSKKRFFPEGTQAEWMKKKLIFSQNVLDGLTHADFEKVQTHASNLAFLGFLEKWTLADRPEYKRQLAVYEFATIEIVRQARDKNLEGATLAYHQLTTSCVQCHKVVRDAKK
jgi:hypothetical protein